MSNPGGATISAEQLKARYVGTGVFHGKTDAVRQITSLSMVIAY